MLGSIPGAVLVAEPGSQHADSGQKLGSARDVGDGFGVQFTNSSAIAALAKELEEMTCDLEPEPDEEFERRAQ